MLGENYKGLTKEKRLKRQALGKKCNHDALVEISISDNDTGNIEEGVNAKGMKCKM